MSEAFLLNEEYLKSALGDLNEKPYENLYNMAKTYGSLNHYDLSEYYLQTIKK